MSKNRIKADINTHRLVCAVLFALTFAFMLWKAPYGLGGSDEAFYLTVPYRLTLGDKLFMDEWHLSQLSAFFTFPFVYVYTHIVGSTEGIMLAARYVYVVLHAVCAYVIYRRLRKYGALSVVASLVYMLFTPFDMMCYSYNTIALDTLALAGVFAGTADSDSRSAYVLGGAFFACAVVCCPYMAVVYLLYFLLTLVCAAVCKKGNAYCRNMVFTWRVFGKVTLGIAIVAVLFAGFFFAHSSVDAIVQAWSGLFTDPEHPSYSIMFMVKHYVYCLITAHGLIILPLAVYCVQLAVLSFDKKRREHACVYLAISSLCTLFCYAMFSASLTEEYYNGFMLPLAFVGFTAYLLLVDKPREFFTTVFALGIAYSVCVCATSNMGFDVMSMAFSVVNIASIVFVALLFKELAPDGKMKRIFARAALVLPLTVVVAFSVYVKAKHCFWDASPTQLDTVVDCGPARGIITSERLCNDYTNIYMDMQQYADKGGGTLLIYAQETWCTLSMPTGYECAGFSAWLSGQDEITEQRLALYYSINPDKKPMYIYIPKDNAFAQPNLDGNKIYDAAAEYGFSVEENNISWKLEKQKEKK